MSASAMEAFSARQRVNSARPSTSTSVCTSALTEALWVLPSMMLISPM